MHTELSWGVNNHWSLYGGGVAAENYGAMSVGIGRDLFQYGALSADHLNMMPVSRENPGDSVIQKNSVISMLNYHLQGTVSVKKNFLL